MPTGRLSCFGEAAERPAGWRMVSRNGKRQDIRLKNWLRLERSLVMERCPWYIAGPLLGLLIVGLRAFLNKPFGALGGYIDLAEGAKATGRFGFRAFLLL